MGRPKGSKNSVAEELVDAPVEEVVNEAVKESMEEAEVEVAPKKVKKELTVKLTVKIPGRDEEGNKMTVTLQSEGELEEAVKGINYPVGTATNSVITVAKGDAEMTRNINPFKARAIFTNGQVEVLKAIFRGFL